MTAHLLARLFEHNDWANGSLVEFCARLDDAVLDAHPRSEREWTVREVLAHMASAQADYVAILTAPLEERSELTVPFDEVAGSLRASGRTLAELASGGAGESNELNPPDVEGYRIAPWVVLLQALNHTSEHRRQVASLLRAQGVTPPRLDGWGFGMDAGAVVQTPGDLDRS